MCSNMHSDCHSLSKCIFLYNYTYKYGYENMDIKKFCDRVTVNLLYTICYHYSMHCVMVARTANHCVMGR